MRHMNNQKRTNHLVTAVIILQIILLMALTWKFGIQRLDGDDTAEMVLANLVAKEGGILSRNWYYSTELRVLNNQVVMSLLFRIFDDWHVVRTFGTGILVSILVLSWLFLCQQIPEREQLRKWSPVVLLPFSYVYYDIVLYGLYYIPHISLIFFSLGLLLTPKEKHSLLTAVCLAAAAFAAGLGGIRLPAVGYAPMLAAILYVCRTRREYRHVCLRGVLACAAAGAGYLINMLVLSRRYSYATHGDVRLSLPDLHKAFTVFKNTVQVCGAARPGLSVKGIGGIAGLLLFAGIVCMFAVVVKERRRVSDELRIVILTFTVSWFVTAFAGVCTTTGWANRYAMIPCMGLIPVLAEGTSLLKDTLRKSASIILAGLLMVCGTVYVYRFTAEDKLKDVRPAYDYILGSGMTFGYSTWEVGDVLTEVSDGRIHMCKIQNYANLWRWNWLMEKDYMKYTEDGPVFLLLDKARMNYTDYSTGHFFGEWTEDDLTWMKQAHIGFEDDNYIVWTFASEAEFEKITGSVPHE